MNKHALIACFYLLTASALTAQTIWSDRQVTLTTTECKKPVTVAIWNLGVDINVLPEGNRWLNPREVRDAADNDANGCADDLNGITFYADGSADNTTFQLPTIDTTMSSMMKRHLSKMKDTTSALYRQTKLMSVPPNNKSAATSLATNYGTLAAGIIVQGNPSARIMSLRVAADTCKMPKPKLPDFDPNLSRQEMTEKVVEQSQKYIHSLFTQGQQKMRKYAQQQQAQIALMFWQIPLKTELSAAYKMFPEMAAIGEKIATDTYENYRNSFYETIHSSPNTLFVVVASSPKQDKRFSERFPKEFDLPNLLVVGATDEAGKSTDFTNRAAPTAIYANGENITGIIAGGEQKTYSDAMLAAPVVVNLAAKILAKCPDWTPAQVKAAILNNGDKSAEGLLLLNPKQTIAVVSKIK